MLLVTFHFKQTLKIAKKVSQDEVEQLVNGFEGNDLRDVETRLKALELEWENVYDKVKQALGRLTRRDYVDKKRSEEEAAETTPIAQQPVDLESLPPKQRKLEIARRLRQGTY